MTTPYGWLAKTYTNCYGHMTNMATMPIYGKNSIYPRYEVYRGYIVFAFSVIMFVCLSVCWFACLSVNFFFPSKIPQQLLGLGF